MDYKPPRGRCNHKNSIISSCPCLRFMLHPVKAATSFDCDGCGHHASFHSLENLSEDAVLKKWSEQEAANPPTSSGATKKRRRIADKPTESVELLELTEDDPDVAASFTTRPRATRKRATATTSSQAN
ncbi:uncharacterized protein RCC_08122 [Ramularia collo-cygni]|uniref:Uncharacterized protein n=1 Tax=Ramularia collo-cygni TaxID=112498 RepID=A0A2D3VLS4_9PEZI|nr:uncharacterized protein RCC_08122 [Ramularia collo-cygni]CZT22253.1 uncharacterized protein RCC_08122 [Ramularia collo-cygni]